MKKSTQKILSIASSVLIFVGSLSVPICSVAEAVFSSGVHAREYATTGKCGGNVSWSFDKTSGKLTVSGHGEMTNPNENGLSKDASPSIWNDFKEDIISVEISDGITSIASSAFNGCSNLISVELPNCIKTIRESAFEDCANLSAINLPDSLTKLYGYAFFGCRSLNKITIPEATEYIGIYAFGDCSGLDSIRIPKNVSAIENLAFYGCLNIKEFTVSEQNTNYCALDGVLYSFDMTRVVQYPGGKEGDYIVPDSVKYVGSGAFSNCKKLRSFKGGADLTNFSEIDFYNCENLQTVELSSDSYNVDFWRMFDGCQSLTDVIIPAENKKYRSSDGIVLNKDGDELIFVANGKQDKCTIPSSVKAIGSRAFEGCLNLSEIEIGKGVESLYASIFEDCIHLTSFEVANENENFISTDNGVYTKDGETMIFAFGCDVTDFTIPNGVKKINGDAFVLCPQLESVMLGSSLTEIDDSVFEACCNLDTFGVSNDNSSYSSVDGVLYNFDKTVLVKYPPKKSGKYTVPEGVTKIKSRAFYGCEALTELEISSSVADFDAAAFYGCRLLSAINVSPENSVYSSKNGIVFDKKGIALVRFPNASLGEYTVPEGIEEIFAYAFSNCTSLTSVKIADTVKSIGNGAFENCENLSSFKRGNGNVTVGYMPFKGCENLQLLELPYGTKSMEMFEFQNCDSLKEVKIPGSIESVGYYSFSGCVNLEKILLDDGIGAIGDGSFAGCPKLSEVTLPDSVRSIGYGAFAGCGKLETVSVPKDLEYIGAEAFSSTVFLENAKEKSDGAVYVATILIYVSPKLGGEFKIKDGTTSISSYAFDGCDNISSIEIPDSVKDINYSAFDYCKSVFVLRGYDGSYAQKYAKENGFAFEVISKPITEPTTEPAVEPTTESERENPSEPSFDGIHGTKKCTVGAVSVLGASVGLCAADIRTALPDAKIIGKNGMPISDEDAIATGMKVVVGNKSVEIAVFGDVDGSGEIEVSDARLALRAAVSLDKLQGAKFVAGSLGEDGISVSSARSILRAAVGLESPEMWMK